MQQTEPVNILLVDDRPENLLSLQAILEDLGQNLISASSGLEALRHLLDREFALILLDVQMPGMDGFETARLIRAREQSRRTPIVFLTAIDQQEAHVFEGYAAGAVDFLFKPFPPEILRAKVSTFVELARQAAERAAEVALRREAEREIRELNDTLERRVRERTAELAREVRERKRAEAALRERVRLGALRVDVSAALARSGDLQCVLQECAAALIRHPGAAFARIWTYSETDDVLELQSSAGEFAATADAFARIRLGDYLIGHVAEQRTPYVTSDLVHDPLFGGREWAAEHRITAFAGYPLLVEHRPVGVMAAFSRRAFTEEVLDAFATIAEGIAQYIQRKRAEEALRGRAEELATLARRKDDFLSMLAHELRNPLGAVSNALHVMNLSGPQAQPFHRARAVAFRQIQHQRRIVDDLLDVARTNRGRLDLRHEPLDLVALVHDTVEDYRAVVDEAQLSVELDLPEVPVTVVGDRVRLAQIVGNLLDNAARFTPAGGEVQISLAVGPEESFAAVTVRDTGVGIEPELLPHLFESLTQADRSLDRTGGGLGLGLALVKGLVELHGGEVRAYSAGPGEGAEFTFLLPLAREQALARGRSPRTRAGTGPIRILVVEDNRDAAETLQDLLQLFGYEVQLAFTGPEGLEAARQFNPRVVLCDIGLPGMDGYHVAAAMRRDPTMAGAHLFAVTGYGGEEDRRLSHEAGFEAHLTKPVDPDELQRLLGATVSNE